MSFYLQQKACVNCIIYVQYIKLDFGLYIAQNILLFEYLIVSYSKEAESSFISISSVFIFVGNAGVNVLYAFRN